jgi:biopolymer transport protein ExbD
MKKSLLSLILTLSISVQALAASDTDYPPISFVGPSKAGPSIDKTQFLVLVVEQGFISHNSTPIPQGGVVNYINSTLKAQGASFLGVHIRQGIKFGDVVKALDELRKTEAKSIGVSMVELAPGKEP